MNIFDLALTLSCIIVEALILFERTNIVTLVQIFDKYNASSHAVSPPPMTITSLPLKKKPSHVAHADTPFPQNSFSYLLPSDFAAAPVEIITDSVIHSLFSTLPRRAFP